MSPRGALSETAEVHTGVQHTEAVAAGLADLMTDTYCLVFKTHAYHWNVEGPQFFSVHTLTEQQYEDMFAATDVLAERIRALGYRAPVKMPGTDQSVIAAPRQEVSAREICTDLAADHERLAHRLHALIKLAQEAGDGVTEDLAVTRSTFHEKAAWMLRAQAAD